MPKRKRTKAQNAATYQRRKQRAIARGYTGYAQKRKVSEYNKALVERILNRIDTEGFNWDDLEQDDPTYWIWFRVTYNKEGTPA